MHDAAAGLEDAEALGLLAEPTRRRLYELVVTCGRPIGREEVAAATGVDRALVAYHLDKLAGHGLLEATHRRPPGRSGPGAGRPAKLYRRAEREFVARAPARDYRLVATVLLDAAGSGGPEGREAIEEAANRMGLEIGRAAGEDGETLEHVLRRRGYEPEETEAGVLRLRNCPFDLLAGNHTELVCGLNLSLVRGILAGLGGADRRAVLEPQPGFCCVAVRPGER